jgi:hypothetical protein
MNRYEWIANRAYRLWEKAGRPSGRDLDFWLAAENDHDDFQKARSDYREKERRPKYGLRELQATDKMAAGNHECEQEQLP